LARGLLVQDKLNYERYPTSQGIKWSHIGRWRPNSWFDAVIETARSQTDSKKVSILSVFYLLEEIKRVTRLLLVLAGSSMVAAIIIKTK